MGQYVRKENNLGHQRREEVFNVRASSAKKKKKCSNVFVFDQERKSLFPDYYFQKTVLN